MKYVTCPACGRKLFKCEVGSKVEIKCPKCGESVLAHLDVNTLRIEEPPEHKNNISTNKI